MDKLYKLLEELVENGKDNLSFVGIVNVAKSYLENTLMRPPAEGSVLGIDAIIASLFAPAAEEEETVAQAEEETVAAHAKEETVAAHAKEETTVMKKNHMKKNQMKKNPMKKTLTKKTQIKLLNSAQKTNRECEQYLIKKDYSSPKG